MGDDIGWENLGSYHQGLMLDATPNLDRLLASTDQTATSWQAWWLGDDRRWLDSCSGAAEGVEASLSIDCPFYMGPTHLSGDGAVICLTGKRAILRQRRLESRRRIAGNVGVRNGVAELAAGHSDDRLAGRFAPIGSLGFSDHTGDTNCGSI
jgi:hypothetical protein